MTRWKKERALALGLTRQEYSAYRLGLRADYRATFASAGRLLQGLRVYGLER